MILTPAFRFSPTASVMVFLCAVLLVSTSAWAETKELQTFSKWSVYVKDTKAGKVCFMSSTPEKLKGDYDRNNRGDTRVFVTHGPGASDRNVVSVLAGYRYRKQSEVELNIDGRKINLFTLDNNAWAQGPEDDVKLIQSMKRGNRLTVTGVSSRNNKTIDEYSLSGFTKAKQFLDKSCP